MKDKAQISKMWISCEGAKWIKEPRRRGRVGRERGTVAFSCVQINHWLLLLWAIHKGRPQVYEHI